MEIPAHTAMHTAMATYPPAPWNLAGQLWIGLFRLHAGVVPVPPGAKRLLGPRWMLLVFVRYLDGVLRYDELAFGVPIVCGRHYGLWVDRIWVDSEPSMWGGRRLWGVPKELARFDWQADSVTVVDAGGHIVTLTLDCTPARLPEWGFAAPGIGQIDGQVVAARGRVRGRLGPGGLRIAAWTSRFGYCPTAQPRVSLALKPFQMHLPAAEPLT
ncbi:MAG TPA: acetoacetate decarboxylase family protein [Herpetosiphonaceae bacterium]|nr:acetoacetate decarboxylase family protein [Herpetosiphonaceae bacterium]